MDILQISYFLTVARLEHLTKAALELNISQPALSITIGRLEKELGCPLFNRIGRRILLNEKGKIFESYARQAMMLLDSGKRAVCEDQCDADKSVVIAATGTRILHEILRAYSLENPQMKIHASHISWTEMSACLCDRSVDFVISSVPMKCDYCNERLLFRERLVLVVHPSHPLASKGCVSLDHIRNERFIALPQGYGLRYNCDELFEEAGIALQDMIECDNDLRAPLIAANAGVTISTESGCRQAFPQTGVFLSIDHPKAQREVFLLWNKHHYHNKIAQDFKSFVISHCQNMLPQLSICGEE